MVEIAMKHRDLLVTDAGECRVCKPARAWDLLRTPYYFHRFLTEVEDVLEVAGNEGDYLSQLRLLVRQLITNSYWLQTQYVEPTLPSGTGVMMLYDEIGYPLTVQIATYLPGVRSSVHSHGTWGVVTVLKGEEKDTLWKRVPTPQFPDGVEPTAETIVLPGDIISFTSGAIHSIEALGDEPTVTFGIYGETHAAQRFEFDPVAHTAKKF